MFRALAAFAEDLDLILSTYVVAHDSQCHQSQEIQHLLVSVLFHPGHRNIKDDVWKVCQNGFRGSVHYHHDGEQGSVQEDVVLEE